MEAYDYETAREHAWRAKRADCQMREQVACTPNPAIVLRIDRGYDVLAFGPMRRLNTAPLTRAQAEALAR